MKCDELKYERLGDANKTYTASTLVIRKKYVDEAIDEIKTKLTEEREFGFNRAKSADHEIGRICSELCELNAENREAKRSLWLMRANNAKLWANFWFDVFPSEYNKYDIIGRMEGNEKEFILTTLKTHRTASEWVGVWEIVDKKCRAKAKEYE